MATVATVWYLYFLLESLANAAIMKELFEFEKTKIRKRRLTDSDPDEGMWINESPQRTLDAVEFMRQNFNGSNYVTNSIQRIYRITRR